MAKNRNRDAYVLVRLRPELQEQLEGLRDYLAVPAASHRPDREEALQSAIGLLCRRLREEGRIPDPDRSLAAQARSAARSPSPSRSR